MKGFEFKPRIVSTLQNYDKKTLMSDIMAGLIVGIVALPLAIAFGIASGVTPEAGILTAIVAGFLISAFGGTKVQIGGPTGAFIIIIYNIIQQYGMQGLLIATFMAGLFLIFLGVFRLGTIIKYIPYPIVIGFTAGIAVTIFTTQVKDLLGLTIVDGVPADFVAKWICYFNHFGTVDIATALVGIISVVVIALTPKLSRKIPGSLVAIILMTVVCVLLKQFAGIDVETIGDRFKINASAPDVVVPEMSLEVVKGLVTPAITIAVLGAIESLLSAAVADGYIGDRHNSNQELIGQGIANMICPLIGGIPATGAIARTMTNINNGGRTPVAGIVHAVVLLLIYAFLMPLAQYIPMSCLAGVLVVVSYNMSGWRSVRAMLRNPKSDVSVLLITFFLTVVFDLTIAIGVGLIIGCLLCMRRMAETTQVSVITDEIDLGTDTDIDMHDEHLQVPAGVEVYEINGPYFFGVANKFEDIIANMKDRPKVRIIRMRKVPFIDSTGLHNLENLCQTSKSEGIQIVLSGVNEKVAGVLKKNHFEKNIGEDNICSHINIALERARTIVAGV